MWSMKSTAACRFNAHKRLIARDRSMNLSLMLLSGILIFISIVPQMSEIISVSPQALFAANIFGAIIVLIISMFQFASQDSANAEVMHRCGLEINECYRNLQTSPKPISYAVFQDVSIRYGAVLQKYANNHADIDFRKFQIERTAEYADLFDGLGWFRIPAYHFQVFVSNPLVVLMVGVVFFYYFAVN
jgi:hypothetical protein